MSPFCSTLPPHAPFLSIYFAVVTMILPLLLPPLYSKLKTSENSCPLLWKKCKDKSLGVYLGAAFKSVPIDHKQMKLSNEPLYCELRIVKILQYIYFFDYGPSDRIENDGAYATLCSWSIIWVCACGAQIYGKREHVSAINPAFKPKIFCSISIASYFGCCCYCRAVCVCADLGTARALHVQSSKNAKL